MKYLTISALFAALLVSSGCANTPGAPAETPSQIAAQVCPALEAGLATLQSLPGLSTTVQTDLNKVVPAVNAVCAIGASVTNTSLQSLVQTTLPAIVSVIKESPLDVKDQNNSILVITGVQVILTTALALDNTATPLPTLVKVAAPK